MAYVEEAIGFRWEAGVNGTTMLTTLDIFYDDLLNKIETFTRL